MVCQTWLTENDDDLEIPGFTMFRCGRSADETGKTRGGGARVYIINQWCTNVTEREQLCTEHVELLCVALRPFYLAREFNQLFITVVYAPLLPLTSR